jgi:hypothetical protein
MPPHGSKEYFNKAGVPETLSEGALNPPSAVKKAVTYHFVDLVRFIATIGIVFIHTEIPLSNTDFNVMLHHVNHVEYYLVLRQVFKFSTICYFLIAGFLLADKITTTTPFDYFKRRINVIAKPYILAVVLFFAVLVLKDYLANPGHIGVAYLIAAIKYIVFYTAFWYIPNYLVCLLVIVCCSKYVKSLYFGGILLLVTLGYTYFNVYSPNYTSSHTTALFGFVFYMWLGVYIKKADLISRINQANLYVTGLLLLLIFVLSNCESHYLFYYTNTHDSLNTLRLTNQLYSVAVFVFLVRCCRGKAPNFGIFNPRKETYGIYLYHSFFIFFLIPVLEIWLSGQFHISLFSYNIYVILGIALTNFVICYFASTALVKLLLRFNLAYLPPL